MLKTATFLKLILLILVATSCQNKKGATQIRETEKAENQRTAVSTIRIDTNFANESFPDFWKRFRSAVISDDTSQLIRLTEFPFDTRGPDDSDSTMEFKKERFFPVFRAFLHQYDGLDMSGSDELAGIKKTVSPRKADITKSQARIGDLVFEKKVSGWKVVFAYLNYETIEEIEK